MSPPRSLGPATAPNWGWALPLALVGLLLSVSGWEATLRLGPGWRETGLPSALSAAFAAGAVLIWRLPPFERCTLTLTEAGIAVTGRSRTVEMEWAEIAAITHRPAALGTAHMTLERAEDGTRGAAPGVIFPVRATGARMEDIVSFLAGGAAAAGFRVEEAGRGGTGRHALPGPRLWVVRPA